AGPNVVDGRLRDPLARIRDHRVRDDRLSRDARDGGAHRVPHGAGPGIPSGRSRRTVCGSDRGDVLLALRRRRVARAVLDDLPGSMRMPWTTRNVLGLIVGLVPLAFVLQIASSIGNATASTSQETRGQLLYEQSCMSCHGADAGGTADGPSLHAVGAAAADFMLSTGRMPLADPSERPVRQAPAFSASDIASIVTYLRTIAPGGPEIPKVDLAAGILADGQEVFAGNCAACHGAGAG